MKLHDISDYKLFPEDFNHHLVKESLIKNCNGKSNLNCIVTFDISRQDRGS